MVASDQQEGRFRVLLIGVGNNTEEEKDSFCQNISKGYRIPFADARKIVDRCPVILKKNLSLRKAQLIAKAFTSFGGSVSIEGKRQIPRVSLEFQELGPHQLALESSYVQKSQRGTWSVTGRARNISHGTLNDTWVLIQLFEDFEEFIAFEEAPLPINPLPSGQTSPFKVIFEGDLSITKISIAFKNASGQPIPAADQRKKEERVRTYKGENRILSSLRMSPVFEEKSEAIEFTGPLEIMLREEEKEISEAVPVPLEQEMEPPLSQRVRELRRDAERISEESLLLPVKPVAEILEFSSILVKESSRPGGEESDRILGPKTSLEESGKEVDAALDVVKEVSGEEQGAEESQLGASVFQEATQLLKEISGSPKEAEAEEKTDPSFSWIGYFRDAVETFYQTSHDAFSVWFEECREKGDFRNSLHGLLTILVHSRFYQGGESTKTLENTKKLFQLIVQPNLLVDQIPPLEGTSFVSAEIWRDLCQRALPKIHQVGNAVLEKRAWNAIDLERMIQVIPQMGYQNSRMAIQWINELSPDAVEVDFSDTRITVGEGLYRVASRLGIVNPHLDYYESGNSMGDTKIQSFAITAFPHHPAKAEKPMASMGGTEEEGGHCFPVQPWCEGCLFKTFCPKLYLDFNPSEKGMKGSLKP
jgi:hypothetical protein